MEQVELVSGAPMTQIELAVCNRLSACSLVREEWWMLMSGFGGDWYLLSDSSNDRHKTRISAAVRWLGQ